MTSQNGWDFDQEDRDNSIMDKCHEENIQANDLLQVPASAQLVDEVICTMTNCQVSGNTEGSEAGIQCEKESHLLSDGMKEGEILARAIFILPS